MHNIFSYTVDGVIHLDNLNQVTTLNQETNSFNFQERRMANFTRMPNYDIRNDGAGPYAIFYCDSCGREFRSQPNIGNVIKQDLGKQALGGLLRKVPLVGSQVADSVMGEDASY